MTALLSPATVSDEKLRRVLDELCEFRPDILRGATAYLAALARYAERPGRLFRS